MRRKVVDSLVDYGMKVPVEVERIAYDFAGLSAALERGGLVSPSVAVEGDPVCVYLPAWRPNVQIAPLAHFMQVLSFKRGDKGIERLVHTNEKNAFLGIEYLFGAVAGRHQLMLTLHECLSQAQRGIEGVCDESQYLFLKEGIMIMNPPRNVEVDGVKQDIETYPDVAGRYCKIVRPRLETAHAVFGEDEVMEEMVAFANIYTQSRGKSPGVTWTR